jgi:hypothetical protein
MDGVIALISESTKRLDFVGISTWLKPKMGRFKNGDVKRDA